MSLQSSFHPEQPKTKTATFTSHPSNKTMHKRSPRSHSHHNQEEDNLKQTKITDREIRSKIWWLVAVQILMSGQSVTQQKLKNSRCNCCKNNFKALQSPRWCSIKKAVILFKIQQARCRHQLRGTRNTRREVSVLLNSITSKITYFNWIWKEISTKMNLVRFRHMLRRQNK